MSGQRILGEVLADAERALAGAGAWAARQDAEAIAAHVFGLGPDQLPLGSTVDDVRLVRLQELLAQRLRRTPVEYVTGRAVLGGVEVEVGPGVFVPRKHTEPLLAWGLEVLRGVAEPVVVDLCAGSGAIALAVAHARPDATVHAVELDPRALHWARRNADRRAALGDTPILLHAADVTAPELCRELDGTVDLLLANPPFVVEGRELPPEWQEHQPHLALYSGHDGLVLIRAVARAAARLLRPHGGVAIEHDDDQGEAVTSLLAERAVFTGIADHVDHGNLPRYTTARRT